MLKFVPYKAERITDTFVLEFDGYYGDMDYDYHDTFSIPDTEANRNILEEVLKRLPEKPHGCSASQDFTSDINELFEKIEEEEVYIKSDDCGDWYPHWDLDIYYYDKDGDKYEVKLDE